MEIPYGSTTRAGNICKKTVPEYLIPRKMVF
jgi:hypothetical protein